MKCVKADLKHAEAVKNKLLKLSAFDKKYKVTRDESYVYFPITKSIKGLKIVDKKLDKIFLRLSLEDELKNKLTKSEFKLLTKSYDIIGDIAIIEIDNKLLGKKKIIAEAMLKTNKTIRTVVRKAGVHEGEYRIREYEFLAGVKNFETLHKENGVAIKLDIRKAYYSPRLSNERLRIAKLVKPGERVLVMFSGVSPYELTITENSKAREVYGIEINPDAYSYAVENVKLNKFNKIKLFCGDVREVLPKLRKKFDRIVMPLPGSAANFLDLALSVINKKGVIHFYCFSSEDSINRVKDFIKSKCKCKILKVVRCGQQSPRIHRFCLDFEFL